MSTLTIINARLPESSDKIQSLHISDGRFVDDLPEGGPVLDFEGKLVLPGLIETHLHLDKACILHRCHLQEGTLTEAIQQTAEAKAAFTEEDVYQRAARV